MSLRQAIEVGISKLLNRGSAEPAAVESQAASGLRQDNSRSIEDELKKVKIEDLRGDIGEYLIAFTLKRHDERKIGWLKAAVTELNTRGCRLHNLSSLYTGKGYEFQRIYEDFIKRYPEGEV